jgi:hypothetical protein
MDRAQWLLSYLLVLVVMLGSTSSCTPAQLQKFGDVVGEVVDVLDVLCRERVELRPALEALEAGDLPLAVALVRGYVAEHTGDERATALLHLLEVELRAAGMTAAELPK